MNQLGADTKNIGFHTFTCFKSTTPKTHRLFLIQSIRVNHLNLCEFCSCLHQSIYCHFSLHNGLARHRSLLLLYQRTYRWHHHGLVWCNWRCLRNHCLCHQMGCLLESISRTENFARRRPCHVR